ncbi:MAG: FMN-binding negative transcriptional regulator [Rhizomicrobium sp.]|jgi:transcriptional regulator
MYRPKANIVDDVAALHAAIRTRRFATIAAVSDGTIAFAYAPVVLDADADPRGHLRFHLAAANPLSQLNGETVRMSFLGPDTYISPDWYASPGLVPTWNYIAVEVSGRAQRLDEPALRQLLVDLSAREEASLAPKRPWTIDKVPEERMAPLMRAIVGFDIAIETVEGKFKLSQEKSDADFAGVVSALEARDDASASGVAAQMRRRRQTQS